MRTVAEPSLFDFASRCGIGHASSPSITVTGDLPTPPRRRLAALPPSSPPRPATCRNGLDPTSSSSFGVDPAPS
jgi:hypothetical protein